jgi:alpha-tubulin suppressor-like RCC1 family protein
LSNSNAPGVPVSVAKIGGGGVLSGVANMAAVDGDGAFCATLDSGGVDCWGSNFDGNLGDGTVTDSYMTALAVRGVGGSGTLSGVISVTSTGRSVCALLAAGGVDCWGLNGSGDLGNGIAPPNFGAGPDVCNSYPCARTPAAVLGVGATGTLSGVVSLSHNREYTYCALLATGGVNCWGGGGEGTLGNGSQSVMGTSPIAVNGIGGRGTLMGVDVVTGMRGLQGGFCAIIDPSRTAACWGNSLNGALGDGSATGSTVPMPVMHA